MCPRPNSIVIRVVRSEPERYDCSARKVCAHEFLNHSRAGIGLLRIATALEIISLGETLPSSRELEEAVQGPLDQNLTTGRFQPISFSTWKTKGPHLRAFSRWS